MTPRTTNVALAAVLVLWPLQVMAGPVSLLGEGFLGGGAPLIQARHEMPEPLDRRAFIEVRGAEPEVRRTGSSLFAGQVAGSFFAPLPQRELGQGDHGGGSMAHLDPNASWVERLRYLIGHAESRAEGYDAINYGAKRLPSRRPTELTLGEVYAWIAATPGQPHAIGRYQFIPSTLKRLALKIGAEEHERFSPRLQDLLADELFKEAGLLAFREGLMSRRQFMNNLAQIWAGLPNSSGRSHYHGYAGNRATMSWAYFDEEMAKIFPS